MSIGRGHGELREMIATMPFEPDPVLGRILPEVARACGIQMACAYRVDRRPEGDRLDFCYSHGGGPPRRVAELLGSFFERSPPTWGRYDPARPEPSERNRAILFFEGEPDLANAYRKYPLLAATAPSLGIAGHDQLRVLICEGPSLLTWLGGFSPEPFTEDQRRRLEEVAGLLRPWLILERQLADTQARAAALDLAVEAIPAAAFLLDAAGRVVHARGLDRSVDSLHISFASGPARAFLSRQSAPRAATERP